METAGGRELQLQNRGGSLSDCSSSGIFTPLLSSKVLGMTVGSELIYKPLNEESSYFIGGWDPLVSRAQNVAIRAAPIASHYQIDTSSYTGMLENQGSGSTSHLVQYQLDHCFAELVPNLSHLGSGRFSGMDDFSIQHKCHQVDILEGSGNEMALTSRSATDSGAQFNEGCQILHGGSLKPSPNGRKRKRVSDDESPIAWSKNMDTEQEMDEFTEEQNEEELKPKQKSVANLFGKLVAKEVKDPFNFKDTLKEDFIHVRAKRGQATNRHSLAERVRRERISERMKFLQDLVPGCNKVTGKAVMLDEIINYVLSLQRQVEFLSMKLTAMYPEMNVEIGRILSRDTHQAQGGRAAILGDPGNRSFYPAQNAILEGGLSSTQSSNLKLHPMPGGLPSTQSSNLKLHPMPLMASIWYNELPSTGQMDFTSNPVPDNPESNSCMKVEL